MTNPLGQEALETLRAAVDTVVPADEWPEGWDGGVATLLDRDGDAVLAWARPLIDRATERLDAAARRRHARSFAMLDPAARTAVLSALASEDSDALQALLRVTYEGYYGSFRGFEPPAWDMIGFRPLGSAAEAVEPEPVPTVESGAVRAAYDVVIVGAGAGGGIAAAVLAESGARVLLVERARGHTNAELRGDHLHGKRTALYDPTAGPGPGHPRVLADLAGDTRVVDCATDAWAWGLNAMAVGGGTRVWQGMSWRFMPEDFEMATRYGVPDGSSLADWPIAYDDLAPYYEKVEWEIGVSGQSDGPLVERLPRSRPYPMPPLPSDACREAFGAAADRLGWGWGPVPFAINSIPRAGRGACAHCPQCVGHASPVNAKNGTHNTVIPRAVATGRCDLLVAAQVVAIEHTGGRAGAVRLIEESTAGPVRRTVRCDRVVVSAGVVETPRLLIVSGLGGPAVGTNLHGHSFTLLYGNGAAPINPFAGPGHSVATLDFVHRDAEAWGGGVLFDAPAMLPLVAAQLAPALGHSAWGADHKHWMRTRLPYVVGAMGIGQEVPSVHSRVTADPHVTDAHGMPVARLVGDVHPATTQVRDYMTELVVTWLSEVGVEDLVDVFAGRPVAAAGEHSAGTCRMGEDPAASACDRDGRLHGSDNVYVADASLLPTNGSVNPCETTMANAWRLAEALVASA
jgi:choline dehydrogenase-like flavoprotein